MEVRDWDKDMELAGKVEGWEFESTFDGEGHIIEDTKIIAANVGVSDAGTIFNSFLALPYWLKQYAHEANEVCYWKGEAEAQKERADKAERKEQKLKESLEHCIEQYPLYDSKEIGASLMIDFMKNILSILYPIDKEEEAK